MILYRDAGMGKGRTTIMGWQYLTRLTPGPVNNRCCPYAVSATVSNDYGLQDHFDRATQGRDSQLIQCSHLANRVILGFGIV